VFILILILSAITILSFLFGSVWFPLTTVKTWMAFILGLVMAAPGITEWFVNNYSTIGKFDRFDRQNVILTLRLAGLFAFLLSGIILAQMLYLFR